MQRPRNRSRDGGSGFFTASLDRRANFSSEKLDIRSAVNPKLGSLKSSSAASFSHPNWYKSCVSNSTVSSLFAPTIQLAPKFFKGALGIRGGESALLVERGQMVPQVRLNVAYHSLRE